MVKHGLTSYFVHVRYADIAAGRSLEGAKQPDRLTGEGRWFEPLSIERIGTKRTEDYHGSDLRVSRDKSASKAELKSRNPDLRDLRDLRISKGVGVRLMQAIIP